MLLVEQGIVKQGRIALLWLCLFIKRNGRLDYATDRGSKTVENMGIWENQIYLRWMHMLSGGDKSAAVVIAINWFVKIEVWQQVHRRGTNSGLVQANYRTRENWPD
jgi:hypothetical protein